MTVDVERLLAEWSAVVEATKFHWRRRDVPDHVLATGGVLVAGARDADVNTVEGRLGLSLPPSYRDFLRYSNGAYGGPLGLETMGSFGPESRPTEPTSLLPVELIGPAAVDDPFSIDLATEYFDARPRGQTTLHQSREGEIAYLAGPLWGPRVDLQRGQTYWSIQIGWVLVATFDGDDGDTFVGDENGVSSPFTMTPDGVWARRSRHVGSA